MTLFRTVPRRLERHVSGHTSGKGKAITAPCAQTDRGRAVPLILRNPELIHPTGRGFDITSGGIALLIEAAHKRYPGRAIDGFVPPASSIPPSSRGLRRAHEYCRYGGHAPAPGLKKLNSWPISPQGQCSREHRVADTHESIITSPRLFYIAARIVA